MDTPTEQLAQLKACIDEAVQKKLDMAESKIREQSEKISGLLMTQDEI